MVDILEHKFVRAISCTDSLACAEAIHAKIESLGIKIKALTETDVVNGYVDIIHTPGAHEIFVKLYLSNDLPNSTHKTTFAKSTVMPTKLNIDAKI